MPDKREEQQQRLREALDQKAEEARVRAEEDSLVAPDRQQDQLSVRAKNAGHKKKTADKWNQ
jgi:hypothetical protein